MKRPKRARLSITVTISQKALKMLDAYSKRHGNRSVGVERKILRHESLMASADLSQISEGSFRALCQLVTIHGLDSDTDPVLGVKAAVYTDMQQNREARENIAAQPIGSFTNDSVESRKAFFAKVDEEFESAQLLMKALREMNPLQTYALVEAIEEVLSGDKYNLEAACSQVYAANFKSLRSLELL